MPIWSLNKLEKTTDITYIPGSPAIPGSEGTAGTPAYSYVDCSTVSGGTYVGGPPTGWDTELSIPLPGGGTQVLRIGGYRYFSGVKAYLTAIIAGVDYVYEAPSQEVCTVVNVPAVAPIPPTPPVPAVEAEIIENYNLGWNSGAYRFDTLQVNKVFTWRFSGGNVGTVVGLTLATAPQDNSYTGMAIAVMVQSGKYQIYRGPTPVGDIVSFTNGDKFAMLRNNTGEIEIYVSGGLVHTETLADDVVPDCSIYSGGDKIWDAEIIDASVAPLNSNIAATTASDAQAVGSAINVTRYVGPGTAIGVAGATTASRGINGQVKVNGSVYVNIGETTDEGGNGGGRTVSDGVALDEEVSVTPTFGSGTALGVVAASTASDAVAAGDPTTGVGISTNTSVSSNMNMLPVTGAASGPNVYVGWTGNYVGDSLNMLPMVMEASGDLAAPVIGLADLVMVPMDAAATGLTGETTISSTGNMLPLSMLGSESTTYSFGYGSMPPLNGGGTDEPYDDLVDQTIEIVEDILATGSVDSRYGIFISELLQAASPTQTFSQLAVELLDALQALDSTQISLAVTVAEALTVDDTGDLSLTQVMKVYEQLTALDSIQSDFTAAAIVLAAIGLSDNKITGGSAEGATAGVTVQDFGPPSVEFTFTGYWQKGTVVELSYTTDAGPGFISYTYEYAQMGPDAMALFAVALDAQPLVNATFDGTSVTMTAQAPATTVQL
jgi:hypothetical protein